MSRLTDHCPRFPARWVVFACLAALPCLDAVAEDQRPGTPTLVTNQYFTFGQPLGFTASVKLVDVDGDGDLDAVAINGRHWAQQDYVFLNNGSGRFLTAVPIGRELATGYEPAIGDLDGDGDTDIVATRDRVRSHLYVNRGDGRFDDQGPVGRAGPARSSVATDLDGDGRLDLVFSERGSQNYMLFGTADGFSEPRLFGPAEQTVRLAAGDINGDDAPDLAFANLDETGNVIALNDGQGNFNDIKHVGASRGRTVDIAIADMNGDGRSDIVAVGLGANAVYWNDDEAPYSRVTPFGPADGVGYGLAVGDLDGDGLPDAAVANAGQPNAVYLNRGDRFEEVQLPEDPDALSYGVDIGDVNGDGRPDLVFANSGTLNRTYLNVAPGNTESALAR